MSDNVAGLGLAQGFMQGFQFMEGIEDRKQRRTLTEKQEQRADESHGLQMASTEQTMRYANEEREYKQGERQRIDDARLAQAVKAGFESGNPDPEMMQEYAERFDIDWSNYVNPEFGKSVDVLKQTASGQSGYRLNSPEVIGAFNTVYRKEIQKGIGEKVTRDGKEYTIVGKKASALVPGKDGKTVMIGLDVQAKDKDGNVITYKAPVTENRSASDDYVKPIDLDKALEQLAGHDLIYRGVQNSPELQSFFNQKLVRLGAVDKDKEADKRFVINGKLVDKNGAVLGDFGNAKEQRPFVIDGKLVDATGKVIGDYGDPDKNKWGDVIQHPTLGVVQVGPGGQLKQFKDPKAGSSGSGGGVINPTTASQIQQSASRFHGTMNPDGSFIMPDGTNRDYMEALMRSEKLLGAGVPLFESIYIANLSTLKAMPKQKALQLAEGEARDGLIEDSDEAKEQRAQQIISDHSKARQLYEQYVGGSGAPQTGAGLQTVQPQQPQQQAATPAPAAPPKQAPQQAVQYLMQNPQFKDAFLQKYGYLPEGL